MPSVHHSHVIEVRPDRVTLSRNWFFMPTVAMALPLTLPALFLVPAWHMRSTVAMAVAGTLVAGGLAFVVWQFPWPRRVVVDPRSQELRLKSWLLSPTSIVPFAEVSSVDVSTERKVREVTVRTPNARLRCVPNDPHRHDVSRAHLDCGRRRVRGVPVGPGGRGPRRLPGYGSSAGRGGEWWERRRISG